MTDIEVSRSVNHVTLPLLNKRVMAKTMQGNLHAEGLSVFDDQDSEYARSLQSDPRKQYRKRCSVRRLSD